MIWVNEGVALDDAGTLIATTYVDMRQERNRTAIRSLVRGCRREHALEDGETILISKPERFREYGEELIHDAQEGLAREETVTVTGESAAQAARQRAIADMNEAHELLNTRIRSVHRETESGRKSNSKSLTHSKKGWIFCASVRPSDESWEAWRGTLPREYDHVSEIGQPAKFAQALARMVTEQIGPQGKEGSLTDTSEGEERGQTKHRTQWVIHGPVVYTDRVYDALTRNSDGRTRLAAAIFTKSTKYAAQREYRFAILSEEDGAESVSLRISGMMRDALQPTDVGLVRTASAPEVAAGGDKREPSSRTNTTPIPEHKRTTMTERVEEWDESRWETRTPDGQVESSESNRRECVREKTTTQDHHLGDDGLQATTHMNCDDDGNIQKQTGPDPLDSPRVDDRKYSEEKAVQKLASEEWDDGRLRDGDPTVVVHRGIGRAYKAYKTVEDMFNDPAFPMSPMEETWQERACSAEEIAKTYGAVGSLAWKMNHIREESRQDGAGAGWHALQCIRNIYARLGDIVESIWIERERFVIIRLKESNDLKATGRIVIAPSGTYAYCLQLPNREIIGHGGEEWGPLFFPMGENVDDFEEFGWPGKAC